MAQTSKSFRHLGSGWKPGTRLWKYLKNQVAQDSQFFCGNLCDVRVTEAKIRFHQCLARTRSGDEPDQDFGRETSRSLRNVLETQKAVGLTERQMLSAASLSAVETVMMSAGSARSQSRRTKRETIQEILS